jgi:hypothetical protein
MAVALSILPQVPNDDSFLESLRVGGVLKVEPATVLSAIKAAVADRLDLYDLPKILIQKIETFAESLDEPVGKTFFDLRKLITRRNYADVLEAIGAESAFVTDTRKAAFLKKVQPLWPALRGFHEQLVAWQQAWMGGMANPGLIFTAMAVGQAGAGAMLPPGLMQPPDTSAVRASAEGVNDQINRAFGGVGIAIARALAADAIRIRQVLENPELPAAMGAANRDQMLKMLGVGVSADIVRAEQSVTRYALGVMEYPKVAPGNDEYAFLGAMIQLGAQIPWDLLKLDGHDTGRSGIGKDHRL